MGKILANNEERKTNNMQRENRKQNKECQVSRNTSRPKTHKDKKETSETKTQGDQTIVIAVYRKKNP